MYVTRIGSDWSGAAYLFGSPDRLQRKCRTAGVTMKIEGNLIGPTKVAWHQFIERTESLRPELFRYCRSLAGSVWDAEDLLQDTLMRAFARLSQASQPIENARAYLFKIASNLWIDRYRSKREFVSEEVPESTLEDSPLPRELRDAAAQLLTQLPPVERAVVLLKDVFDLTLEETATALDSTVGAVKAALHRGRAKLNEVPRNSTNPAPRTGNPSAALVDQFIDAFNARDVNRLTMLMREDASSEMVSMFVEHGQEAIGKGEKGVLHHTFASGGNWRGEVREFKGEPIGILWAREGGREAVSSIVRVEEREGAISRLRYYFFCPETLAEVCSVLGVPVKTNGYRPTFN
jgi:RNA polymerase sigma-70 factor (ECF subfamily)